MARSKEQNEAMRAATREKIHAAAVKLFAQKGFAGTGVQEIADLAGISIGLLYRHYKTKEDVFGALATMALSDLEKIGEMFDSGISPVHSIQLFAKEIASDIANNEEFVQYMELLSRPIVTNQDLSWVNDLLERNKIFESQIVRLIERGQREGSFRAGCPTKMAQFFLAAVQGACTMKQVLKDRHAPPTAPMLTAFLLKEEYNNYE